MAEKKPTKEEITRRRKKTVSVKKLAEQIRGLRQKVTQDMKSDDEKLRLTAMAVALMDCTAERVGNDDSAEDGHVGVTGFQKRHVTVSGDKISLKYTGKSGVKHDKEFTDERCAKIFKELLDKAKGPNDFLLVTSDGLKIKAAQVNRYLSEYDVTAKDIRGYAANHMVIESLKNREKSSDEKERKKVMSEVLTKVAEAVGHGKATLRKHYLLPNIEDDYIKRGKIPSIKEASLRMAAERVADFFYTRRIAEAVRERELLRWFYPAMLRLKELVDRKYEEVFGEHDNLPDEVRLAIVKMPEGKVGSYKYDGEYPFGLLSLSPKVFEREPRYACWVIAHELAHAAMGNTEDSDNHGPLFRDFATALGIPEKYQD